MLDVRRRRSRRDVVSNEATRAPRGHNRGLRISLFSFASRTRERRPDERHTTTTAQSTARRSGSVSRGDIRARALHPPPTVVGKPRSRCTRRGQRLGKPRTGILRPRANRADVFTGVRGVLCCLFGGVCSPTTRAAIGTERARRRGVVVSPYSSGVAGRQRSSGRCSRRVPECLSPTARGSGPTSKPPPP